MSDNTVFAARIRELRQKQGLSQRAAALSVGRTAAVWAGWERGKTHPRSEAAADIARALTLPVAALYAPKGWTAIAELLLPDAVLERIKRDGEPYAREIAAQYAQAVLPTLMQAASRHGQQPRQLNAGQHPPRVPRRRKDARIGSTTGFAPGLQAEP